MASLSGIATLCFLASAAAQTVQVDNSESPRPLTGPGVSARVQTNVPPCPPGFDCIPPKIDPSSGSVQYDDPFYQWKALCPDKNIGGPCWELRTEVRFSFAASDPSGISAVGLLLSEGVNHRNVKPRKYLVQVTDIMAARHSGVFRAINHVAPGEHLDLVTRGLCARDSVGNEACVTPTSEPQKAPQPQPQPKKKEEESSPIKLRRKLPGIAWP